MRNDTMATERHAGQLAEFFKFTKIGQAMVGRITKFGNHPQNGEFIVMEPVLIRAEPGTEAVRYAGVAVGLSTDLKWKITSPERDQSGNGGDRNKFISIEFIDKEPSKKGSDKKMFRVLELTREEMISLASGKEDMNALYKRPIETVSAMSMGNEIGGKQVEDEDDLPF
jgi:hypothetical protein